jgi:hypothetical protein
MSPLLHRLFESPLVDRFGWTLLHALWQGTAVALLLLLALTALRRRGPRPRYFAACAAMALLAALPAITFLLVQAPAPAAYVEAPAAGVSPTNIAPQPVLPGTRSGPGGGSDSSRRVGGAAVPVVPPDEGLIPETATARPEGDAAAVPPPPPPPPAPLEPAPTAPQPPHVPASGGRPGTGAIRPVLPWLVAGWAAGVLALSVWNFGGWVAVQRLKRRATEPAGRDLLAAATRLGHRIGLARLPSLRLSSLVASP